MQVVKKIVQVCQASMTNYLLLNSSLLKKDNIQAPSNIIQNRHDETGVSSCLFCIFNTLKWGILEEMMSYG